MYLIIEHKNDKYCEVYEIKDNKLYGVYGEEMETREELMSDNEDYKVGWHFEEHTEVHLVVDHPLKFIKEELGIGLS